jgi:hypothetical protein
MMKLNYVHKVFTLFLFLLIVSACESSKKTAGNKGFMIEKITLEKSGMRGTSKLEITKDEFSTEDSGRGVEESAGSGNTTSENWSEINRLVSELDLNEFENWESPTQERFHDGARATTITLEINGKSMASQPYDEGKPPAQLKELNDYLESLVNQ